MKTKKVPLRKCVVCNERKPKKELIRIVKTGDKEVSIDLTGKANGRGAYLCLNVECINEAEKSKRLSRSLETEVPNSIYEELKKSIS